MHPVDIVLIDLDGTISDSSPGMLTGFRKVFDRFDMEQPSDESIRRHFGPPLAVTWREVYGMTDEQIVVGLEVYREYYHDVGMFENNLYDGVPELIKDLHAEGVKLSTATSKPEFSASRIIEHFGLREYFTFIGAHGPRASIVAEACLSRGLTIQRCRCGLKFCEIWKRDWAFPRTTLNALLSTPQPPGTHQTSRP